jgi:hypothetical protein
MNDSLNKKQRIVMLIAIMLVLAAGLFPPYRAADYDEKKYGQTIVERPGGRGFLLRPKQTEVVGRADWTEYEINLSQLSVEFALIVLIASGLILLFQERRSP